MTRSVLCTSILNISSNWITAYGWGNHASAGYLTGNQSISLSGDISGSGTTSITTSIGSDKITEAMLKAVNSPTDEYYLTYESTTGDFEWQTCGGGGSSTKTIDMLASGTVPDATGNAFFEPYSVLGTNDLFRHLILRLGANNAAAPTVKSGVYGRFHVPEDYNTGGTVTAIVYWTSTLTSGDVVFDLDYRAIGGDDSESLDQASYQESLTVTDTAPSAANERQVATMTLTASNLAVADTFEFFVGRDGAAGADTLAGSAIVHEVIFSYTN